MSVASLQHLLALLVILLAPGLAAQGILTGTVFDAAGGEVYLDEPAMFGAVGLPATSPPFNEITAAQWQGAFTAIFDPAAESAPLGGLLVNVAPIGSFAGEVSGDGTFHVEGLPLETRLGVAVRVGEMWWPLREEVWLTASSSEQAVRIPYYRLGADPAGVKIERYQLNAGGSMREDLKYAPITLVETIEIINPDSERAAMVNVELDLLMSPGLSARSLPSQYGAQLMYMQGWNATAPVEKSFDADAATAWTFGTGGGMHGQKPEYAPRAYASADNWHQMNSDPMLAMVGAGETQYRVNATPGGRSATLVFNRPVPPARDGVPGLLVLHLVHKGGVMTISPSEKISLKRSFEMSMLEASASVWPQLTFAALVEGAHRRLYGEPIEEDMRRFPPNPELNPDLAANEVVQLIFGFGPEAQKAMAELEARAAGLGETPEAAPDQTIEPKFDVSILFKALALLFGLAFVGALVATIRKPREKQIEILAELPASRREVLEAVNALEREYTEGKFPARAYQEQRQRLMNRLVEFDSRSKDDA
jgi:hypothetical protein